MYKIIVEVTKVAPKVYEIIVKVFDKNRIVSLLNCSKGVINHIQNVQNRKPRKRVNFTIVVKITIKLSSIT